MQTGGPRIWGSHADDPDPDAVDDCRAGSQGADPALQHVEDDQVTLDEGVSEPDALVVKGGTRVEVQCPSFGMMILILPNG